MIDRLAVNGDPRRFPFSIPKISDGSLDFSFSGFKTAALRHIEQSGIRSHRSGHRVSQVILDLVASYQQAIVDTLIRQTERAAERRRPASIFLVGGVACNSLLRRSFKRTFESRSGSDEAGGSAGIPVYFPSPALTTDNAAMIAAAGTPKLRKGSPLQLDLNAYADLRLC